MSRANKKAQQPFSDKQLSTLALSYQCIGEMPKIDFKKLAALTGYTEGAAKFAWGEIKAKLKYMAENETTDAGSSRTGNTPNTGKSAKGLAKNDKNLKGDDDGEDDEPTTPVARKRKAPATPKTGGSETGQKTKKPRANKALKIKEEPDEDEDEVAAGPFNGMTESAGESNGCDDDDAV